MCFRSRHLIVCAHIFQEQSTNDVDNLWAKCGFVYQMFKKLAFLQDKRRITICMRVYVHIVTIAKLAIIAMVRDFAAIIFFSGAFEVARVQ